MIYFEDLPLDKEIIKALSELKINYVFQPIFYPDGKTIYAHEALMRPEGRTVLELICSRDIIWQDQRRCNRDSWSIWR